MSKVQEALENIAAQGCNIEYDKAIFILDNGTLEISLKQEEKTLEVVIHDKKVYVSDELADKDAMEVALEIAVIEAGGGNEDE